MITQNDIRLGKQIQKLRKKAGLKQHQIAENVGVSSKYIQYIEAASRQPSLKTLYKIARVLNVKVQELFTF
jgi:transcriptional regulator with XRE-family HTH domain